MITNLTNTGAKLRTYVYLGGTVVAEQWLRVLFKFNAPVTGSEMQSELSGELSADGFGRNDHAALGISVPPVSGGEEATMPDYTKGGHTINPESGCQLDRMPISCRELFLMIPSLDIVEIVDLSRGGIGSHIRITKHTKYGGHYKDIPHIPRPNPNEDPDAIYLYTDIEWVPTTMTWNETRSKSFSFLNVRLDTKDKGFPCPLPWVFRGIFAKGGKKLSDVLQKTWDDAEKNKREEGGWIYMDKKGNVKAVRKTIDSNDSQTGIYLGKPPNLKGWIVIANFHTHDTGHTPSESVPGFVTGDTDINRYRDRIPGLILGTEGDGELVQTPYGPERGFFRIGVPKRCQRY